MPRDIRCERRIFNFRYRSAAHWIQVFREFYGPTLQGLRRAGRCRPAGAGARHRALLEAMNTAGAASLVVPSEYLEIVITKR